MAGEPLKRIAVGRVNDFRTAKSTNVFNQRAEIEFDIRVDLREVPICHSDEPKNTCSANTSLQHLYSVYFFISKLSDIKLKPFARSK
jgi:hypothetical protein